MPRLSRKDTDSLCQLRATLDALQLSRPHALPHFLEEFREALSLDLTLSYTVQAEETRFSLGVFHYGGSILPEEKVHRQMGDYVTRSRSRLGFFNPLRPEPAQRNRAISVNIRQVVDGNIPSTIPRLGLGSQQRAELDANMDTIRRMFQCLRLEDSYLIRALVCEGETMLVWLGGLSSSPMTSRQAIMLNRLIPALQRRLSLEERLCKVGTLLAALSTAMDYVPGPAFLVTQSGRIELTNAAGRHLLAQDRRSLTEALVAALHVARGGACTDPIDFEATPVHGGEGYPLYYMVVRSSRAPALSASISAATLRYGLTVREAEVLALLVRGASNKVIANTLDCADRTVEVHVSRLLEKIDVESRSALAAKVLFGVTEVLVGPK